VRCRCLETLHEERESSTTGAVDLVVVLRSCFTVRCACWTSVPIFFWAVVERSAQEVVRELCDVRAAPYSRWTHILPGMMLHLPLGAHTCCCRGTQLQRPACILYLRTGSSECRQKS